MGRNQFMLQRLKWIVFSAGALIFVGFLLNSSRLFKIGNHTPSPEDYPLFFLIVLLPSITAALLGLFENYWGTFILSFWFFLWLIFLFAEEIGNPILNTILLIIPSLVMFFAPFLRIVLRKDSRKEEKAEQKNFG